MITYGRTDWGPHQPAGERKAGTVEAVSSPLGGWRRDTNLLRDRLVELIDEIYNLRRQLPDVIEISEVEVEDNSPAAWRTRLSRAYE